MSQTATTVDPGRADKIAEFAKGRPYAVTQDPISGRLTVVREDPEGEAPSPQPADG